MASIKIDLAAEMDDGSTFEVTADQRDMAAWEAQPFGGPVLSLDAMSMSFLRFMGWHAANRQGIYKSGWQTFNRECIEVTGGDQGDDAEVPATHTFAGAGGVDLEVPPAMMSADPGRRGQSGPPWFNSPDAPVNP